MIYARSRPLCARNSRVTTRGHIERPGPSGHNTSATTMRATARRSARTSSVTSHDSQDLGGLASLRAVWGRFPTSDNINSGWVVCQARLTSPCPQTRPPQSVSTDDSYGAMLRITDARQTLSRRQTPPPVLDTPLRYRTRHASILAAERQNAGS
ncbi:hypothetical protein BD311DRAFT_93720 [Dichomitus squalens]|uniref:Uncharacterized protein n=1 Tax=Dichomitus squalens TaxID=114155 RepID=A0A4Q9M834_9APHY|nr:hypothetical protein BD311DRAFT_93720 [Dichomitus squalens]